MSGGRQRGRRTNRVDVRMKYVWQQLSAATPPDYPDSARPELTALVRGQPRRALEIGCHKGAMGAALKERFKPLHYVGIEVNEPAAAVAKTRLDEVIVGDFLTLDTATPPSFRAPFDVILLADVLEHLYDPWHTLVRLRPMLADTGSIYVSLPNIRNFHLINELAKGNWSYASEGLLDVTHIRFFSRKEAIRMFAETGFQVVTEAAILDPNISRAHLPQVPVNLVGEQLSLHNVDPQSALEFATLQFLFVLEKG